VRSDLPTGTVTFLFTDVEGSTRLLHELGAEAYAEALAEHRRVIREACVAEGGVEVDTQGDAFFYAFPTAPGAVTAASALTEALASGPVQVRVGLHTGTPLLTEEGYVGDDVHRAARIAAAGHGGQVVLSSSPASLVEGDLLDLGEHRFKDLAAAERVFQAGRAEFPPLKSFYRSNLPIPAHPLVGRKKELLDVMQLLREARIVSLTGPGGVGKTRFAVAVAGEVSDSFPDGVWFVPLAPLRDEELVLPTIAAAVGADDDLEGHLTDGATLLLLDNLEHLIAVAPALAELVGRCPNVRVLVTSRESLRVAPEREYPLSPLPESPSVELFRQRAEAVSPGHEVEFQVAAAICDRVDRLPLAIELAAARAKALAPEQILERLSQRLDLLKGGRDADPRQQTLRATIEWSHELLSLAEKQLFTRLSVFAGGCTLEAAEEVCDADLDTLQSLVEKSLVRLTAGRYWLLETIREFASEHLEHAERERLVERLGRHLVALGVGLGAPLYRGDQAAKVERLEAEYSNCRVVMEWSLARNNAELAGGLVMAFKLVWGIRGHYAEARRWIEGAYALRSALTDQARAQVLIATSDLRKLYGDSTGVVAACDELVELADEPSVDPLTVASALADLSDMARADGRLVDARRYAEQSLEHRVAHGLPGARALTSLGELALVDEDLDRAAAYYEAASADYSSTGFHVNYTRAIRSLAEVARRRRDYSAANGYLAEALEVHLNLGDLAGVGETLQELAVVANDQGRLACSANLWGAGTRLVEEFGLERPHTRPDGLPDDAIAEGAAMSTEEAVEYAFASID
jgi:predicted ATPase